VRSGARWLPTIWACSPATSVTPRRTSTPCGAGWCAAPAIRRGRVKQLIAAAHTLGGADRAALELAIWGRPLAALELAATAHHQTPELVCARALACYRAGRPDLTERILAEDLPPPEVTPQGFPQAKESRGPHPAIDPSPSVTPQGFPQAKESRGPHPAIDPSPSVTGDDALPPFPGPHEQWMIQHAPAACLAIAALASGRDAIVALAQLAPHDAEPDPPTIEPLAAVVHRLGRGLAGRTVYLAGEFKQPSRDKLVAAIEAAGARLVAGPAPGTDFYVPGDGCSAQTIARLERQGVRRLRELEEVGR